MIPKITRLTPSFTKLELPGLTLWYSYETVIAFQKDGQERKVSQNVWSSTTGKHLNMVGPDRIPYGDFFILLDQTLNQLYNTRLEDLARVVTLGIDLVQAAEMASELLQQQANNPFYVNSIRGNDEMYDVIKRLNIAITNWRNT